MSFNRNCAVFAIVLRAAKRVYGLANRDLNEGELFHEVAEIVATIPRTYSVPNAAKKVCSELCLDELEG
jgi:hypothetical protein